MSIRSLFAGIVRPQILAGIVLLVAMLAVSVYAVRNWRRKGAMTPIEAQAMDMSHMPPPVGRVPVTLARVERGPVAQTARYSGTAVGYVEQEITPRVQGWITWMPLYAGDRVRRGQLLAKLDTQELDARVREREAARRRAEHDAMTAQHQYRQSLSEAARARAEIESRQGMLRDVEQQRVRAEALLKQARHERAQATSQVAEARQSIEAAGAERAEADAELAAAETMLAEAEAQVAAAKADQTYTAAELQRAEKLQQQGVIALAELQKDRAAAQNATARVNQAEARLRQVREQIRAAQAKQRKAAAVEKGAAARIAQMESAVAAGEAKIEQATADIEAAKGRAVQARADVEAARAAARALEAAAEGVEHHVAHSQAGVGEAGAALARERTVKGYTEIRSLVDGVIMARKISPGVLVAPGQAILTVAQVRPIRIQANVPETDLARIRKGHRVRVRGQRGPGGAAGPEVSATVTTVFPAVDPGARTGIVEALLPNEDDRFLPGQFVDMEITLEERAAGLRVPAAALVWRTAPSPFGQTGHQQASLWVAEEVQQEASQVYYCPMHPEVRSDQPGLCPKCRMDLVPEAVGGHLKARRVDVTPGISDGRFTELLSGVPAGTNVVVAGHQNLRDGDILTPAHDAAGSRGTARLESGGAAERRSPGAEGVATGQGAASPHSASHPRPHRTPRPDSAGVARVAIYTCPMHPEVTSHDPNATCPKCGMKLVPRP